MGNYNTIWNIHQFSFVNKTFEIKRAKMSIIALYNLPQFQRVYIIIFQN